MPTKNLGILFDGSKGPELKAFSDSDWSTLHSTTGIVFVLAGAPVSYASKRQQSIAFSPCEAEIMAASVAATETVYVREILRNLGLPQLQPTTLGVDNKGAIQLAKAQGVQDHASEPAHHPSASEDSRVHPQRDHQCQVGADPPQHFRPLNEAA